MSLCLLSRLGSIETPEKFKLNLLYIQTFEDSLLDPATIVSASLEGLKFKFYPAKKAGNGVSFDPQPFRKISEKKRISQIDFRDNKRLEFYRGSFLKRVPQIAVVLQIFNKGRAGELKLRQNENSNFSFKVVKGLVTETLPKEGTDLDSTIRKFNAFLKKMNNFNRGKTDQRYLLWEKGDTTDFEADKVKQLLLQRIKLMVPLLSLFSKKNITNQRSA